MRQTQEKTIRNRRLNHWMALVGTTLCLLAGQMAWADSSCTAFLAAKVDAARATGQWYHIELTMHREDISFVTYSAGFLSPGNSGNYGGGFYGRANQGY